VVNLDHGEGVVIKMRSKQEHMHQLDNHREPQDQSGL